MLGEQEERDWYTKTENLLSQRFSAGGIAQILSYLEPFRWNADWSALASDHSEAKKTEVLYKIIEHLVMIKNIEHHNDLLAKTNKYDS